MHFSYGSWNVYDGGLVEGNVRGKTFGPTVFKGDMSDSINRNGKGQTSSENVLGEKARISASKEDSASSSILNLARRSL